MKISHRILVDKRKYRNENLDSRSTNQSNQKTNSEWYKGENDIAKTLKSIVI